MGWPPLPGPRDGTAPADYAAGVIRRLAPLCVLTGLVASVPALAQVQVDTGALDRLAPTSAPAADAAPDTPARHRVVRSVRHPAPVHHAAPPAKIAAKPVPASPSAAPVTIPPAPPPAAALAPATVAAAQHTLPPPLIPMAEGAAGDVSPIPGGLRITFGAGKAEFSPASVAALHGAAKALAGNPAIDVNVFAYAAGAPDDPSTPRRLSLSRALAARAVLLSDNIASTRIYLHALGSTASAGPPDRVDVQAAGVPQPQPVPAPPGPQAASAAPKPPVGTP